MYGILTTMNTLIAWEDMELHWLVLEMSVL